VPITDCVSPEDLYGAGTSFRLAYAPRAMDQSSLEEDPTPVSECFLSSGIGPPGRLAFSPRLLKPGWTPGSNPCSSAIRWSSSASTRLACIRSCVASSRWLSPGAFDNRRRIPTCGGVRFNADSRPANCFAAWAPTCASKKESVIPRRGIRRKLNTCFAQTRHLHLIEDYCCCRQSHHRDPRH